MLNLSEYKRIGLDLHGTLDTYPELMHQAEELHAYCKLFIISGPPRHVIGQHLDQLITKHNLKIETPTILSVQDYLQGLGVAGELETREKGLSRVDFWTDDSLWWGTKSILCDKYNIDIYIDDQKEYLKYFGSGHKTRAYWLDSSLSLTWVNDDAT